MMKASALAVVALMLATDVRAGIVTSLGDGAVHGATASSSGEREARDETARPQGSGAASPCVATRAVAAGRTPDCWRFVADAIGGTPVTLHIDVAAGAAARIRVHHSGVYCVLRLLENGQRIGGADDTNGASGDETLAAPIRDADASYDIVVVPIVRNACGSVEASLEYGQADDRARDIVEAHRQLFEARRLEDAGDGASQRSALLRFDDAIAAAQRAGEPGTEGEALLRSAIVAGQLSRIAEAIERVERAIPIFHDLGFKGAEGRAIDRRGELARRVGDVVAAERDLKAALPLVTEAVSHEGIADVRNNLGLLYEQSGQWDQAIVLFEEALHIADHASDDTRAALYANLGNTYSDMGDYQRALAALGKSLELRRKLNIPRRTAQTLQGIALVQTAMGEPEAARRNLEESLKLWQHSGDPGFGGVYASLGRLELSDHRTDNAIGLLQKAVETQRLAKDRRSEARSLTTLAKAQLDRGETAAALELANQALAGARDSADRQNEAASLYIRALVLEKSGRLDDALTDAESAVEVVESMREAIVNPELRSTYLGTVRKYFDLVIELLMLKHERDPGGGFAAEAFRANERSRARTLLESLARSQADVVKGVPPELLARERNLRRELDAKTSYRALLRRTGRPPADIAAAEGQIAALTASYREVKAQVESVSPEYAALEFPEPLPLAAVQARLLDAGTTLLEYHLGKERSYVWVVSDRDVIVRILAPEARLEALARTWHDLLRRNPAELDAAAARALRGRVEKAGRALARAVLDPVSAAVKGKRLLIVADGALHYIPFAAMPEAGQPLVAAHEIAYLPSATLLDTLRHAPEKAQPLSRVAVFADPVFQRNDARFGRENATVGAASERSEERWARFGDFRRLRFTRKEAEAILAAADRQKSLEALDFRASKQTFTSTDLRRFGIVHIATHGIVNAEEPDLSGLVFSRYDTHGRKVDGYLRLHDVYNLDLHAELVVLSACRTALGKVVYGEGLISLTRGFMYGGARRVMSTVWSVDDRAATNLMARVYDAMLRRRASPARALRQAQTAMLRDPRWSDPYYWAAFTLQGDWK